MSGDWKPLGRVSHIARYPLKAAGGEALDSSRIGWHGVSNDRGFALLRTGDPSGLPWVSSRQFPRILRWTASTVPTSTALRIATPDRDWLIDPKDLAARAAFAEFATDALGEPLMLVRLWSGTHDAMPVSVISTATMRAVADLAGAGDPAWQRFRPNVVIETDPGRSWPERQWLGRELRLGDGNDAAILRVDRHTTRCEVLDLAPGSGADDNLGLFAAVRSANRNRAGVYATPRHVGEVTVGGTVWLR
ncbi:MOSC domain-containing protein [Dactylosporangium roseum]|uniref:MOSC domain-containing protein n=1 Tax=Dactylosporangium roseum TaxID=47989 RepID=A0ABY5Z4T7_9ACTN|nr:MOSC N-terminal beta barrel domain-containing protein [Dactylosporangium roseum]UWZ36571.1 MOSC domain-containing protein [Dactylosporangium roseum]